MSRSGGGDGGGSGGSGRGGIYSSLPTVPSLSMASRVFPLLVLLLGAVNPALAEPNVVVLLANNVRADDLSCFNPSTPVATPNIDRMAAKGALLQHHTVPGLTLTANRAAHITGQLPFRYGLQESDEGVGQILHTLSRAGLPKDTTTYAEIFKKFGYRTKAAGSWELGWGCSSWTDDCHGPLQHGFDSFHGVPLSAALPVSGSLSYSQLVPMRALEAYLVALANRTDLRDIYQPIAETAWYQWLALAAHEGGRSLEERTMMTESLHHQLDSLLVRDDAVVHWPYTLRGMTLPILSESLEFIRDNHRAKRPFLLQHTFLHVHKPSIAAPHRAGDSDINAYYDDVLELDWAVGRILDELEKLDIMENTIVYFASDYNDIMAFRPSMSNITDTRIPGIFLWPGSLKPHVMRQPTSALDLLPTLVDVIGRGEELLNMTLDGRSLFFPLLTRGESSLTRFFSYRGLRPDSTTVVFPEDDDSSIYKVYLTRDCQLCKGSTAVYNLTADPYQEFEPISEEEDIYKRVTEEVRKNLYVLPSEPSQLGDFWQVMPLPDLFPWTQVSLYQPEINVNSADNLYSFLEADVIFAAEPGSGEQERETRRDELDPELSLYYRRDRDVLTYAADDEVF